MTVAMWNWKISNTTSISNTLGLGEGGVIEVEEGMGVTAEEVVVWVVAMQWVRRVVKLAVTRGQKQKTREKDSWVEM